MQKPENHLDDPQLYGESDFESMLAAAQPRLRGYVASLLGDCPDVDDLVQETNMVLLHKRGTFTIGTNFIAWAFRIAYFKATTWRRNQMREGRVVLSEMAFQQIAAFSEEYFENRRPISEALKLCLQRLPLEEQELVHLKYVKKKSLVDHAALTGRSAQSLHKQISRIRFALRNCIRQRLRERGETNDFP